jgi:hypothetical protein
MTDPTTLVAKHRTQGAIIDTNLLLLWVTGLVRQELIGTDRLRKFTASDFPILQNLISKFDRLVATPHIVTEVDNLSRQIGEWQHENVSTVISSLLGKTLEIYVASRTCSLLEVYAKVGITDASIFVASNEYLVITDDFKLSGKLSAMKRDVLNFHHIRQLI